MAAAHQGKPDASARRKGTPACSMQLSAMRSCFGMSPSIETRAPCVACMRHLLYDSGKGLPLIGQTGPLVGHRCAEAKVSC
jgi:hypothetical protein